MPKELYIIGIDEVGRGPIAGPVTVSALALPRSVRPKALKDSKRLSAKQRDVWFGYAKNHPKITFATARVYPGRIDAVNIRVAANIAAHRALMRLTSTTKLPVSHTKIFLDGGLFVGNGVQPKNARTVVRGDEKINAIKLASIVAKVSRDRYMTKLAKKYPEYGFEIHKGYGTKGHVKALKKHGPNKVHRLTFIKKWHKM